MYSVGVPVQLRLLQARSLLQQESIESQSRRRFNATITLQIVGVGMFWSNDCLMIERERERCLFFLTTKERCGAAGGEVLYRDRQNKTLLFGVACCLLLLLLSVVVAREDR